MTSPKQYKNIPILDFEDEDIYKMPATEFKKLMKGIFRNKKKSSNIKEIHE